MKHLQMLCHVLLTKEFDAHAEKIYAVILEQVRSGLDLMTVTHPSNPITKKLEALNIPNASARWFFSTHQGVPNDNVRLFHAHDEVAFYWSAIHKKVSKRPYIGSFKIVKPIKNNSLSQWVYANTDGLYAFDSIDAKEFQRFSPNTKVVNLELDLCTKMQDKTSEVKLLKEKFDQIYASLGFFRDSI